jgi:hypothetical protein
MSYQTDFQAHVNRTVAASSRGDFAARDTEARHWEEMEQLRRNGGQDNNGGSGDGFVFALLAIGFVFVALFFLLRGICLGVRGLYRLARRHSMEVVPS